MNRPRILGERGFQLLGAPAKGTKAKSSAVRQKEEKPAQPDVGEGVPIPTVTFPLPRGRRVPCINPRGVGEAPPSHSPSYHFVQRGCTEPQFLPLENETIGYLAVRSRRLSIQ